MNRLYRSYGKVYNYFLHYSKKHPLDYAVTCREDGPARQYKPKSEALWNADVHSATFQSKPAFSARLYKLLRARIA
jgi:hypothetical protein